MLIVNLPGSVRGEPDGARVLANERPLGFAANVNRGVAATSGELVLVSNPDTEPAPDAVATLAALRGGAPARRDRRAAAALARRDAGSRRAAASRRSRGTLVRRTPLRSLLRGTYAQRGHYLLDERPTEPVQADWLLGAFLLMRRAMLDELGGWDEGFRHYGEDIDLAYRASGGLGALVRAGRASSPTTTRP